MAYVTTNPPKLTSVGPLGGVAGRLWNYSSTDVHTDVDAPGYFTNGYQLGMKVGDVMHVIETDNSYAQTTHSVITVNATTGAATISAAT